MKDDCLTSNLTADDMRVDSIAYDRYIKAKEVVK
jgi:hypothetical protein